MKFRAVSVAIAVILLVFGMYVKLHAHPIDVDLHVFERMEMEKEIRERDGKDSWERSSTSDNINDRDIERGFEWARDSLS